LAYKIPPFFLDSDRIHLAFCDKGPHKVRNGHGHVELKVECDVVIEEANNAPAESEHKMKKIRVQS